MNRDGDVVVAWAGAGVGDRHGVFSRAYDTTVNAVGPLATELYHVGENPNVGAGDSYLFVAEGDLSLRKIRPHCWSSSTKR